MTERSLSGSVESLQVPLTNVTAVGGTVLELMASISEMPELHRPGPPPTPPVEMSTTTRSGDGYAQISDDSMTDHMYE